MRLKQQMGAGHFITQLFFGNGDFYRFRDRAREAGVTAPIAAGIMPVTGIKQIERIVSLRGAPLPPAFAKLIAQHAHDPDALRAAGIDYAVRQIADLIEHGTQGIHLYTMNNPAVAAAVTKQVRPLIEARNREGSK
jgi:methylenetetrahydrofolate reductase (NADPH)